MQTFGLGYLGTQWMVFALPSCCSVLIYPCILCLIQEAILKPLNIAAHNSWSSVVEDHQSTVGGEISRLTSVVLRVNDD